MKKSTKQKPKHLNKKRVSFNSFSKLSLAGKAITIFLVLALLSSGFFLIKHEDVSGLQDTFINSEDLKITATVTPESSRDEKTFYEKIVPSNTVTSSPTPNGPTSTPTPTPVPCETIGALRIQGTYVDEEHNPVTIPGQKVTIINKCTGEIKSSTASPNWSFTGLPRADYKVYVEQIDGYTIRSNNCGECTFHPNFGGSNITSVGFALNKNQTYEDIGFQYWNNAQPTPIEH